ncbi:MAG: hypothetical protein WDN49_18875 [Acetobacteraceae bacterium]
MLAAVPAHASDYNRTYQVVSTAYDVGAYEGEVDRMLQEADGKGVFGGAGSTPAGRAQDKVLTRASMLRERDVVLRATTTKVANSLTDAQIDEVIATAGPSGGTVNQAHVRQTVAAIKASFNEAAWSQLTRVARGNSEFLCSKGDRTFCH